MNITPATTYHQDFVTVVRNPTAANALAFARKHESVDLRLSDGANYADMDVTSLLAGVHKARIQLFLTPVPGEAVPVTAEMANKSRQWLLANGFTDDMGTGYEPV